HFHTLPVLPSRSLFPYTTLFRSICGCPTTECGCWTPPTGRAPRCECCWRPPTTPSRGEPSASTRTSSTPPGRPSRTGSWSGCSRSEEHTSELQSRENLVCRLLLD